MEKVEEAEEEQEREVLAEPEPKKEPDQTAGPVLPEPAEQPKPAPKACAKKKVVCKKTFVKKKMIDGQEQEEEEEEFEYEEIDEEAEEEEDEEQETEEPIRQWDEIPTEEQLALCRKFVDILMDIGTQNRIIGLIVKTCKKKQAYLDDYPPPTKCLRREIVALKYSINLENERKRKYLLQMKNFLGSTPYGPWDFVTFTTKSLDNPDTELCMGLNDYICTKLSECPAGGDGNCKENKKKLCLSESFFTFT